MGKFHARLENNRLTVELDLDACGFSGVERISVFPTDENLTLEDPDSVGDVRYVLDVSGSMKPPE